MIEGDQDLEGDGMWPKSEPLSIFLCRFEFSTSIQDGITTAGCF